MNYNIVVVTYNRKKSLERLLESLAKAYYDEKVRLIISIDHGGDSSIVDTAKNFNWEHGEKLIIEQEFNLGLKKHIMFCGDLTRLYGDICIFEDDLVVSPLYFSFFKASVEKYSSNPEIAGISLYNHKKNISNEYFFEAVKDASDVYLLKYAMSWGQIWTVDQWERFSDWYSLNEETSFEDNNLPSYLNKWSEQSWLKYHIKYCIENNKYFIYPHHSFSTNFSDAGTHSKMKNTNFQVPLTFSKSKHLFELPDTSNLAKYDAFFENETIFEEYFLNLGIEISNVTIDIYGIKKEINTRYLLSSKVLDFRILKMYGLELKPHELNILYNIDGEQIFLYDRECIEKNKIKKVNSLFYYFDELSFNILFKQILSKIKNKLRK